MAVIVVARTRWRQAFRAPINGLTVKPQSSGFQSSVLPPSMTSKLREPGAMNL